MDVLLAIGVSYLALLINLRFYYDFYKNEDKQQMAVFVVIDLILVHFLLKWLKITNRYFIIANYIFILLLHGFIIWVF